MARTCARCGKPIEGRRSLAKWCSDSCKVLASKERHFVPGRVQGAGDVSAPAAAPEIAGDPLINGSVRVRAAGLTAQQVRFCDILAQGHTVTAAAKAAGLNRTSLYKARERSKTLAAAWDQAWQAGRDVIVDEIFRRGILGWDEPVYHGGKLVGTRHVYDSNHAMFLAKQRDPTFRDNYDARKDVYTGVGKNGEPLLIRVVYEDKPPKHLPPVQVPGRPDLPADDQPAPEQRDGDGPIALLPAPKRHDPSPDDADPSDPIRVRWH